MVAEQDVKDNLALVISATLTLLGLVIGFTFSMAITRYDQRRLFEEGEANAIGTECVRADLLPAGEALGVKQLLVRYLRHRIEFFQSDYGAQLSAVDEKTVSLQTELWNSIRPLSSGPSYADHGLSGLRDE